MSIETQFSMAPGHLVVTLRGAMTFHDYGAADALLGQVCDRLDGANGAVERLVFDLAAVNLIDSHWLGLFVRALKRAQDKGVSVALRRPQPAVRRLLDLVQFGRVFEIQD